MGEIAEMMLEGELCQGCGVYLEGSGGYARFCPGCGPKSPTGRRKTKTKRTCVGCNKLLPKETLKFLEPIQSWICKPCGFEPVQT